MKKFSTAMLWLASLASLVSTLVLCFQDKTASATITAGLSIILVLLTNLERIDTFKGWGIEAKMIVEKIDNAKQILSKIQSLARIFVSQGYSNLGDSALSAYTPYEDIIAAAHDLNKMADLAEVDQSSINPQRASLENALHVSLLRQIDVVVNRLMSQEMWDNPGIIKHDPEGIRLTKDINLAKLKQKIENQGVVNALEPAERDFFKGIMLKAADSIAPALKSGDISPELQALLCRDFDRRVALIRSLADQSNVKTTYPVTLQPRPGT